MPLLRSKQQLLLPVKPLFVFFTLGVSVLLNCFPWAGKPFVPDFVALTLVFWAIHQPRMVGMGAAFALGLLMDVVFSTALGQYALAYVIMTYVAVSFSRRVMTFGLLSQMLHVAPILLIAQAVVAVVGYIITQHPVDLSFWSGTLTAVALWPVADFLLIAPQRRAVEKDENRPI